MASLYKYLFRILTLCTVVSDIMKICICIFDAEKIIAFSNLENLGVFAYQVRLHNRLLLQFHCSQSEFYIDVTGILKICICLFEGKNNFDIITAFLTLIFLVLANTRRQVCIINSSQSF